VPAWLLQVARDRRHTRAAAFAGRVLGTISAVLIAIAVAIGLLMPLVITALARALPDTKRCNSRSTTPA